MTIVPVKVELIEKESVKIYRMSSLDLKNDPILWVSAYLIDGLLIDCGHHHARDAFLEVLELDNLEKCVLSHQHEDHFGACYDLQSRFNIPIYANIETALLVRLKLRIPYERELVWGTPKPCKTDFILKSNEITTEKGIFKIIHSPGHCSTLISFFHDKRKLLFSTDAFIDERQNVIFNWENALKMLETFQNFKKLNPRFLFLEDGRIVTIKELNNLIVYWNSLKKQSENLYNQGLKPKEIVKKIFGKESWLKVATGGDMSRENLIRSLLNLPQEFRREKRKRKST
jgi:glyoxylase-like metal-dependent hydrolase (beta-lactamase superfamily II)